MSRLRVNSLTNKTNDGAPEFMHGASVVGVVTATSFSGDGSGLTNITGATQIIKVAFHMELQLESILK